MQHNNGSQVDYLDNDLCKYMRLTGCLAAATAAAAAAAFIAPALGYIPTSNTRGHRLQHTEMIQDTALTSLKPQA
ncbi:unnamed protein product [Euphydryas editha]|uniref:Uncharacterized protein n=1 Tax=Euphydryas editha TaxID=104508 RepID=A0AAU9TMT0_EUPED|nr:unnamed protein product [Euphydryas editha]